MPTRAGRRSSDEAQRRKLRRAMWQCRTSSPSKGSMQLHHQLTAPHTARSAKSDRSTHSRQMCRYDKDGDGQISISEFLEGLTAAWVKSAATPT